MLSSHCSSRERRVVCRDVFANVALTLPVNFHRHCRRCLMSMPLRCSGADVARTHYACARPGHRRCCFVPRPGRFLVQTLHAHVRMRMAIDLADVALCLCLCVVGVQTLHMHVSPSRCTCVLSWACQLGSSAVGCAIESCLQWRRASADVVLLGLNVVINVVSSSPWAGVRARRWQPTEIEIKAAPRKQSKGECLQI
jgi:hypothetical protein